MGFRPDIRSVIIYMGMLFVVLSGIALLGLFSILAIEAVSPDALYIRWRLASLGALFILSAILGFGAIEIGADMKEDGRLDDWIAGGKAQTWERR